MLTIAAWFDAEARTMKPLWGLEHSYDNTSTREILGINFIDFKQSVCEMSETLISTGYIP